MYSRIMLLFIFIYFVLIGCSTNKNPLQSKSSEFIVDSFSTNFMVKINSEKDMYQGFVTYAIKYHFENQSGSICSIEITVNDFGFGLNITPAAPTPINKIQEYNFSTWIGDDFTDIDTVIVSYEFEGGFWDCKNSYGSFNWNKEYELPVIRE